MLAFALKNGVEHIDTSKLPAQCLDLDFIAGWTRPTQMAMKHLLPEM
jgi:hypothetical protein